MSDSKVLCQCCGKMMVPKTIFSRGFYGGWGWWVGGGRPVSSCCPFCLSENWDDPSAPVEKSVSAKTNLLLKVFLIAAAGYGAFHFFGEEILNLSLGGTVDMVAQWAFVLIAIFLYRRHKNTKR